MTFLSCRIVFEGFPELEDLLKQMLVKDFNNRIKMDDFLSHSYTTSLRDEAIDRTMQQVANLSMAENVTNPMLYNFFTHRLF